MYAFLCGYRCLYENAHCITLYWDAEGPWVDSNRHPQRGIKVYYTTGQILQAEQTPYTLSGSCMDYPRFLLLEAVYRVPISASDSQY